MIELNVVFIYKMHYNVFVWLKMLFRLYLKLNIPVPTLAKFGLLLCGSRQEESNAYFNFRFIDTILKFKF